MAVLSKTLRSMKENAIVSTLPPTTKYSYSNIISSVFISLLGLCGRKLSIAEEGRTVVSEQATVASLEPKTTNHPRCPSTRKILAVDLTFFVLIPRRPAFPYNVMCNILNLYTKCI